MSPVTSTEVSGKALARGRHQSANQPGSAPTSRTSPQLSINLVLPPRSTPTTRVNGDDSRVDRDSAPRRLPTPVTSKIMYPETGPVAKHVPDSTPSAHCQATPPTPRTAVEGHIIMPTRLKLTLGAAQARSSTGAVLDELNGRGRAIRGSVESLRGGKGGSNRTGWGKLPVKILHHIFYLVQAQTEPERILQTRYNSPAQWQILCLVTHRIWMSNLRTVCMGWKSAVESDHFWDTYTLILDNSRHNRSTLADVHSSSLEPSTPTHKTLFHRSRNTTLEICLPCRVNRPGRAGLYPADSRCVVETPILGTLQTCKMHHERICNRCLTESTYLRMGRNGADTSSTEQFRTNLKITGSQDTDEYDLKRNETVTCAACREYAVLAHVDRILTSCARNSYKVRTSLRSVINSLHASVPYIEDGVGTAKATAMMVVEEVWLHHFSRWDELVHVAHRLQSLEYAYFERMKRTGYVEYPTERAHRHALLVELWGDDWLDQTHLHNADIELKNLFTAWAREIAATGGFGIRHDDAEITPPQVLTQRYWLKLREALINDLARDRVSYGLWVSPRDEIVSITDRLRSGSPPSHTPFEELARHVYHPLPADIHARELTPPEAVNVGTGIIPLNFDPINHSHHFLPPERLVAAWEEAVHARLQGLLAESMLEVTSLMQVRADMDGEKAENMCAELGLDALLAMLSTVGPWEDGTLTMQFDKFARANKRKHTPSYSTDDSSNSDLGIMAEVAGSFSNPPSEDGGATINSSDYVDNNGGHQSPRIELVDSRDVTPPNYQIEQVTPPSHAELSVTTGSSEFSHSPGNTLGKRKDAPTMDHHREQRVPVFSATTLQAAQVDEQSFAAALEALKSSTTEESALEQHRQAILAQAPGLTEDEDTDEYVLSDGNNTPAGSVLLQETSRGHVADIEDMALDEREEVEASGDGVNTVTSRIPEMLFSPDAIPYIPQTSSVNLGPRATAWLNEMWWEARSDLRACRCRICERTRKRDEDDEVDWFDTDDYKRIRLG